MGIFDFSSDDHDRHAHAVHAFDGPLALRASLKRRNRDAYNQVYQNDNPEEHKSKFSHELLGGGAAYAAMHEYEKRQKEEGHKVDHGFAKQMLAGLAGGEVDKLVETKGLDFIDREKAKHHARQQAERMYDQQYGGYQEGGDYS